MIQHSFPTRRSSDLPATEETIATVATPSEEQVAEASPLDETATEPAAEPETETGPSVEPVAEAEVEEETQPAA